MEIGLTADEVLGLDESAERRTIAFLGSPESTRIVALLSPEN
jgi:hypothetical protein